MTALTTIPDDPSERAAYVALALTPGLGSKLPDIISACSTPLGAVSAPSAFLGAAGLLEGGPRRDPGCHGRSPVNASCAARRAMGVTRHLSWRCRLSRPARRDSRPAAPALRPWRPRARGAAGGGGRRQQEPHRLRRACVSCRGRCGDRGGRGRRQRHGARHRCACTHARRSMMAAIPSAFSATESGIIYPAANRALYERVARDGLLLTEMPPGERPRIYTFPHRNRLIAGLAQVTVVVEAAPHVRLPDHRRGGARCRARRHGGAGADHRVHVRRHQCADSGWRPAVPHRRRSLGETARGAGDPDPPVSRRRRRRGACPRGCRKSSSVSPGSSSRASRTST